MERVVAPYTGNERETLLSVIDAMRFGVDDFLVADMGKFIVNP